MQCPKCGYQLDAFATGCPRCAREAGPAAAKTASPRPSPAAAPQPSRSPAYLAVWGVLLLIALGMIGFAGYRLLSTKPPAAPSPAASTPAPTVAPAAPAATTPAPAPRAVPGAETASPQPLIPAAPEGGGNMIINAPSRARESLGRSGAATRGDATAPESGDVPE